MHNTIGIQQVISLNVNVLSVQTDTKESAVFKTVQPEQTYVVVFIVLLCSLTVILILYIITVIRYAH